MRYYILLIIVFFQANALLSQCKPVFSRMQNQPPTAPLNYYNYESFSNSCFAILTLSNDTSMYEDTAIINYWNGTAWNSLPKLLATSLNSGEVMEWGNRVFVTSRATQFDNKKAPAGNVFSVLQYRNGVWDSLPGALLSDTDYCIYRSNKNGLYRLFFKDTVQYFTAGNVQKYDTIAGKFINILSFSSSNSPVLIAGYNRLLIAGVDKVNGNTTAGFAYIDSTTLYLNTDKRFSNNALFEKYAIDITNDHIYTIPYSTSPVILEFSNQFVSSRQTSTIRLSGTGGSGVYDGKILFVSYDQDDNRNINVLCPNETAWKTSVIGGGTKGWANHKFNNTGFYLYDYNQRKTLKMGDGSSIEGYAYVDLDSNCTYDTLNEPAIKDQLVTASSDLYTTSAITDNTGHYELFVIQDTVTLSGPGTKAACLNDTIIVGNNSTSYRDMPTLRPGFNDLKARILNGFNVRWNGYAGYYALIENKGEPADSAHFEFKLDNKLKVIAGDSNVTYFSGNIAKGQLKDLGYFDKRMVMIGAWVDSAANKPDSIVCSTLEAYLYIPEKDSMNNRDTICQRVVYSYDPNHKTCNKDTVPVNISSKLEYQIEFQNEGNGDVVDVVITDRMSTSLDIETFEIIGASHPYTITINTGMLTITFKDINLKPKKTDEAHSTGFFKYAISTKKGLKNKTLINNTANIYFDLNKPITTNTAVVRVSDGSTPNSSVALIKDASKETLVAYPNPSKGELTILSDAHVNIHIYNMEGQEVYSIKTENDITAIDNSAWPSGIYLIRCGTLYCKIIKVSE